MESVNIEARKIAFVQEFLKLQNEELITLLEKLLHTKKSNDNDFRQMTVEELNTRIDKSMDDSENDRVTTSKNLKSEIEKWG